MKYLNYAVYAAMHRSGRHNFHEMSQGTGYGFHMPFCRRLRCDFVGEATTKHTDSVDSKNLDAPAKHSEDQAAIASFLLINSQPPTLASEAPSIQSTHTHTHRHVQLSRSLVVCCSLTDPSFLAHPLFPSSSAPQRQKILLLQAKID